LKGDRPNGNFEVLGIEYGDRSSARLGSGASRKLCNLTLGFGQSTSGDFWAAVDNYTSSEGGVRLAYQA
jgi:hypothetical protein